MIATFADKETEKLYLTGKSKKMQQAIIKKALYLLEILDGAECIEDLQSPPGNRLHSLSGDLQGFWSISINMQWRIVFRFENENAYDVQIVDYH